MNKYAVKIPYSYTTYACLSGVVYADNEEEAKELATDHRLEEEDHYDTDSSDDSDYDYDNMEMEMLEEDIDEELIPDDPQYYETPAPSYHQTGLPEHYLSELALL